MPKKSKYENKILLCICGAFSKRLYVQEFISKNKMLILKKEMNVVFKHISNNKKKIDEYLQQILQRYEVIIKKRQIQVNEKKFHKKVLHIIKLMQQDGKPRLLRLTRRENIILNEIKLWIESLKPPYKTPISFINKVVQEDIKNIHSQTINKCLKSLEKKGLIEKIPSRKNYSWWQLNTANKNLFEDITMRLTEKELGDFSDTMYVLNNPDKKKKLLDKANNLNKTKVSMLKEFVGKISKSKEEATALLGACLNRVIFIEAVQQLKQEGGVK